MELELQEEKVKVTIEIDETALLEKLCDEMSIEEMLSVISEKKKADWEDMTLWLDENLDTADIAISLGEERVREIIKKLQKSVQS